MPPTRVDHPPVAERRVDPQRFDAETGQVVELPAEPGEVAAVEELLVSRVEPVLEPIARVQPAPVVAGVAVGEAVDHRHVERHAGQVVPQRVAGQSGVVRARRDRCRSRGDQGRDGGETA
nr:hypothetical protein [Allokutzneria sp. NRRL B-24872]